MSYIYTQSFDHFTRSEEGSVYYEVVIDFDVDEIGEWIDGVWTVYHDVAFICASWFADQIDEEGFVGQENLLVEKFGKKQVTEWTEYVREKLDEEYVYE